MNEKIIFVVEFLRNNDREQHSYVGGVFEDEFEALLEAWEHMRLRAGKYGAEVSGYRLKDNEKIYTRKLDCWDSFASSCKDLAEKITKIMEDK